METFYDILEVAVGASQETITAAYRSLCKRYHPDANEDSIEATQRFKKIIEAYETLRDPSKLLRYDEVMRSSRPDGNTDSPALTKSKHRSGIPRLGRSIAIRLVLCGVACLLNGVGLATEGAKWKWDGLFIGMILGLIWSSFVIFVLPPVIRYMWRFGLARLAEVSKATRGEN
jgi:preprotein translocase subunit Sec63